MDEAERCTEVGLMHNGHLLGKDHPDLIKKTFRVKLLEVQVEPQMPALLRLGEQPAILGASLRSGWIRLYSPDPESLLQGWQKEWPFSDLRWMAHRWTDPDMEDVFRAYSQGFDELLTVHTHL